MDAVDFNPELFKTHKWQVTVALPAKEDDLDRLTDEKVAQFQRNHGKPPEFVLIDKGQLWIGPVRQ